LLTESKARTACPAIMDPTYPIAGKIHECFL